MSAQSQLFLPKRGLSSCLAMGIYRDSVAAGLGAADRVNHFPASPLVTVTRVFEGQLEILPEGGDWRDGGQVMPERFVMGPQPRPVSSWSRSGVRAFTVGIFPDAWLALGGDPDWTSLPDLLQEALGAEAPAERFWQEFCDRIAGPWAQLRQDQGSAGVMLRDWMRGFLTRMALSNSGRSLRAMERRVKRHSAQTRQTLEFYSSVEELHRLHSQNPDMPPAELAHMAGYSDQSHMGRAVRRATGFSPAALNRMIAEEEPFWCYRLLGERY